MSVAQWVYHHNEAAGLGTDTLAGSKALYLPIRGSKVTYGVLAVEPTNPRRILLPEQRHLLETFAGQVALALERALLAEESESARVAAESENLRRRLLASIAHDLKKPIEKIKDACAALAASGGVAPERKAELIRTIGADADHLAEVVSDSLELVRLEAGAAALRVEPHSLAELVAAVLDRLAPTLSSHPVTLKIPPDLPQARVDAPLIMEVLENLLKNASRYTPAGTTVTIEGRTDGNWVQVLVEDSGPGLPPGDPALLFQPFERGDSAVSGTGLGLAICKTIVAAHGGVISAWNRPEGGAAFEFSLPVAAGDAA
jgi:two-component system sensor histidine kinase KdpD